MGGTLSRRGFVRECAWIGLALAGAGGVAGCAADGDKGATSRVKVLHVGQPHPVGGFDPQVVTGWPDTSVAACIFESPLRFGKDGQLLPGLFAKVPVAEMDEVTFRCELRPKVRFHDGTRLTAKDVKYTFERMFRPETGARAAYLYDAIRGAKAMLAGAALSLEGIHVTDDEHLTIVLDRPTATFTKNLALPHAAVFPHKACEAAGAAWGRDGNLIGTGPYRLAEGGQQEDRVVLEPFSEFHGDAAPLDRLEVVFLDGAKQQADAFQDKGIDCCELDDVSYACFLEREDLVPCLSEHPKPGVQFVNLNLRSEALKDVRVREALSLAIDRTALVKVDLPGVGEAASGWLSPGTAGFDDEVGVLPFDPKRSRDLLEEAGQAELGLLAKVRAQDKGLMEVVGRYWKAVGVKLEVEELDVSAWQDEQAAGRIDVTTLAWVPPYADGDAQMYTYFARDNAARRSSYYDSVEFNEMVERAHVTYDANERVDLYRRADELLTRVDFATIPLYYPVGHTAARPYVTGLSPQGLSGHLAELDVDLLAPGYVAAPA